MAETLFTGLILMLFPDKIDFDGVLIECGPEIMFLLDVNIIQHTL